MSDVVDELVEDALRELADELYQRQLWLASSGPEVSSLEECISRLWDDSGLVLALERQTVYSAEIDDGFRKLKKTLSRIDSRRAPEVILDDALLRQARSMAAEILDQVRLLSYDES